MLKAIPKLRKILEVGAALHSLFPASACRCSVLCTACCRAHWLSAPAAQHGAAVPGGPAEPGAEVLGGLCMAVLMDTWTHEVTAAPGPP